jgi:hypothetical protein
LSAHSANSTPARLFCSRRVSAWFAYWIGVYLVLGKTSVVSDVYTGGVIDQALSNWLAERIKDAGLGVG